MSSIAKFDIKKFNGSNDFGVWRVKMRCLLIQHGWEAALDLFPETMEDAKKTAALKTDAYKKAHSALLLCLDNKLLMEVNKEDSAAGVWINLNSRELKKRTDAKDDGNGLYVRGRSDHQGSPKERLSKKEQEEINWLCQEECGIGFCSFHMTPRRDFLFDFKEFNGGTVLPGNNRACAIIGTGKVRVQMKDGLSFVLENVRYIPELKRNLISLGTLDREGYTVKLQNGRSGLPDSFWAEATVTETYLINRSPSTTLEKKTPMDLWSGHLANYEMLRIFGCVAYSHMNQGKLKPRAIKCIFLGYPDGVKGYRLWRLDDVKPKIIISRDVVFNESLIYKDTLKGAGAADSGKEVEFKVKLQGSRVEPTIDPHTGENPWNEDEEQDKEPQQQNLENYVLVRNIAKRMTTIPARYRDEGNVSLSRPSGSKVDDMAAYAVAIAKEEDTYEPITFQDLINSFEKDKWVRAMEEEMSSLKKNHTWELVDQPPGQKLVSCKWLYKIKEGIEGVQKPRYKARLVARGFTQRVGIDYNKLEQLGVKTAFLHGNLEETIYMRQPPGFKEGTDNKVCLSKKSLYGLKQSPRQWYKRFDVYMINNGFSRINYDSCVYFKEFAPGMYIYLLLYVDDMLIAWKSKSEIEYTKGLLRKEFDMKELGHARKILGMEIVRDRGLVYGRDQVKHVDVDGFMDADYAKDLDKGRSITGYVFMVHGYVLKGLLIELGVNLRSVVVNCDNQSAIHLSRNAMFHERTKHINVRYHFIREIVKSKEIGVAKIGTKDNATDAFTKVVPGPKFKYCMKILGVGTNYNMLKQATLYAHSSAFSTMTIRDPTWNMDTSASSYLNSHSSNLSTVYNKCLYPLVCVGDGKSIPVTNTGHSILPTLNRPLYLHNVLVTPNIIKNLIYVRQFTRDNNCTVEFDAFGFSVKDFLTRHILLRCDSSGDLYPVTQPSLTPHALLSVSTTTWHQRLGHPGEEVLRSLVSRQFISCNKDKSPHVCQACQLGKHVRLPFSSSNSIVSRSFEIVHSDIWTSPIVSSGGFKYYVLFLDHYSHYLWIYPLCVKSEMFQKFLYFWSYVNNQFKSDISAFQCDHGGEFDNNNLLNLFSQNGIQMRFSCPKTSQQNGKSERMIRTINNVIRTLLFLAHLPPSFWVEALHMAAYLLNILPSSAIQNDIPFGTFKPNPWFHGHTSHISPLPKSPFVALSDPHWRDAMYDEYNALIKNSTWILVPKLPNVNVVWSMWLFRHKYHVDGSLSRYKAYLIANRRNQQYGVDCSDTFSQVVKPTTIRTIFSLALARNWPVHQLDVKNAFLNGDLTETVYMYQPSGFMDSHFPHHVCRLQRSLYGLKQAPRAWFQRFEGYALRVGFTSSRYLLQLTRDARGMFLSQKKYAMELLERVHMWNCNATRTPVDTESKLGSDGDPVSDLTLYRSLAGGLQYLTFIRPDISYAVQQICLHMHDPREPHLATLKRVLCYIRGTLDHGLQLHVSSTSQLNAYTDADWAGCLVTQRSTSGYCVFLGDNLLSWSAKRQVTLSCSSAEAEYHGVANVVAETAWIRNLLRELHTPLFTAILVYCDNVSAVYMSTNPVQHQRTKHIEIDIHFVRDMVARGHVRVLHVPSRYQYADIFTKGLPTALFEEFRTILSVRSSPAQTAREYENKMKFVEQPTGPAPDPETADPDTIDKNYETVNLEERGQSLSSYFLKKMKSYLDALERLGYAMPHELRTIAELHAMLKLHEKGIPNKAETLAVLAIWEGKIQKDKRKPRGAKGKDKGKNKLVYAPKPKISPSPKRDNPAKDSICHHYKEGLRRSKKLKHGTLSLYMCNEMRAAVEAIRSFDLILSNGLIILLPKSFWGYALESASRILNMIPTKKVERTPYEIWHGKAPKLSYLMFWGYEALVNETHFELPPNGRTVGSKWLFKKKTDMDGNVHTFKALLVAKGYTQTYGVDYGETFSPVADIRVIRILLAIATFYDYEIWQMDVKIAFLNGHLSEDVYMVQPKGFVDLKHPNKVCKLHRSIYGLKQASRTSGSSVAFLILYADDILLMGNNVTILQEVKSWLFELKVSCYADASFQTDKDDTKSQTGYVFVLNGGAVDWKSAKKSTTAMSFIEVEYIAAIEASMEAV
ncbi:ribonuclease H-like domain-containing protein [Tanacetum coccineum]